jgi:hypothetical protein
MMTLQLRIGGTLLAASQCGQQTFDFIEEGERWANLAFPDLKLRDCLRAIEKAFTKGGTLRLAQGRQGNTVSLKMLHLWRPKRHPNAHVMPTFRCVRL